MVNGDKNQTVIREDEALRPAAPAIRIEIGFMVNPTGGGGQPGTEIMEQIAADDVAGPCLTETAAMPAMRPCRVFADVARRQPMLHAEAVDRFDKPADIPQPELLREAGEPGALGRVLSMNRCGKQQKNKPAACKHDPSHASFPTASIFACRPAGPTAC
jgi:hypothetical protein